MTTIQASTQPIQASGNGKSGSSDNSIAAQISSI
ncbi:MAG TPA: FlxA protein, partial [Leclercia adecarboxylata]|nr:FlxA protein [Leclercia adecarboxylata]